MMLSPDLFADLGAFQPRPLPSRELIVVGFAGGGGSCTGIEQALGRSPDVAINHDLWALAVHAKNHPDTLHVSKNIWHADPIEVAAGRPVGLAWFSPDCKHFSKAKGGKPVKASVRDLAWVVVLWAKRVRPRVIMLENVEEFRDWGPLTREGLPDAARKGQIFERWVGELRRLGYKVEWRELKACDYGAPTTRKRFFLIARRDGQRIVWPAPTHGDPKSEAVRSGALKPWRTAADVIDWSLPCPSIFATTEEIRTAYGIAAKRPLAEATMTRIARGVWRYVIRSAEPFIIPVTHCGDSRTHPIHEPVRTITTAKRGELALVSPFMVPRYGERLGQEPRTQTVDQPAATIVPSGNGGSLVAAHLTKFRQGSSGVPIDTPMPTITANSYVTRPGGGAPLGVVAAFLAQHNTDMVGHSAEEPVSTIVGKGCTQGLVAAHLMRQFGASIGSDAADPAPTVTAGGGGKTALVAAHLINLRGGDRRDAAAVAPLPTVSAGGNHVAEVRAFLTRYYGEGGQWSACTEPVPTDTTKPRFGLVTVAGEAYEIVDIGMRMLTPRERFNAQGFPPDYVIDAELGGKTITLEVQGRLVGNSVCPPVARALVAANCADMALAREAAE